jgi:hypothetical protein
VLFDRFFLGGGLGGAEKPLSKPLSMSDDEQELFSMSVAIQSQMKTDHKGKNSFSYFAREKLSVIVCGERKEKCARKIHSLALFFERASERIEILFTEICLFSVMCR